MPDYIPASEYGKQFKRPPSKLPLGDYTAAMLKKAGVTPERYAAAKKAVGLPPTCNCQSRQIWLNKVGKWLNFPV